MRMRHSRLLLLGLILCGLPVALAAATETEYALANLAESGTSLIVPKKGVIELCLVRRGAAPQEAETLSLHMTSLRSPEGDAIPATLSLLNPKEAFDPNSFKMAAAVLALGLKVDVPTLPRTYTGMLILSRGGVALKNYPVSIKKPATEHGAKILLERAAIPIRGGGTPLSVVPRARNGLVHSGVARHKW